MIRSTLLRSVATGVLTLIAGIHAAAGKEGKPLSIRADVNWTLGTQAADFFSDYRSYLGGKTPGFEIPIGAGFSVSSYQFDNVCIGIAVGYRKAAVRETFMYNPEELATPIGPAQSNTQTITVTSIPLMLTADYWPGHRQFTGYIGGGLGVSPVAVYWDEVLSETSLPGGRTGGVRYNSWIAAPTVMARSGVFIGFDTPRESTIRPGVFFEVGYQWLPVTDRFFAETARTITQPPEGLFRPYTIHSGGIVLKLGITVIVNE